jgi:DNA sulfur modification protein DndD
MRLTQLVLSNIGPFRGRHFIDLNHTSDSTGFAIFAENGRGKTTLYNAMRWCLFGEVRERAKTVAGKRIEGSLRPMVGDEGKILMNDEAYKFDSPQEMSVVLIADGPNGRIQVSRTATSSSKFARSDNEMVRQLDVKIGSGPLRKNDEGQESIESFFPRELERFFFIDGEALEEYTEMMQSSSIDGLQKEVNAVLGIPALVKGEEDLTTIRQTLKSSIEKSSKALKKSSSARDEIFSVKRKLKSSLELVTKKEKELRTLVENLENTVEQMKAHQELAPLIEELKIIDTQIEMKQLNLTEAANDKVAESKYAWQVLLWTRGKVLHSIYLGEQKQLNERERNIQSIEEDIDRLNQSITDVTGICDKCHQPLPDIELYRDSLKKELDKQNALLVKLQSKDTLSTNDLAIKIGDLEKIKPQKDTRERILKSESKWKKLVNEISTLDERKRNLNSKISDEAKANVAELGELKGRQEATLAKRELDLKNARSDAHKDELELKRLNKFSGDATEDKESVEINRIVGKLQVAIKDTISSYREKARSEVEKRSSEVFVKLINAPDVYTGIKVDKNFKTKIRNSKSGFERSPSSGMVSMMTISIIDALRQVSGIDAPVFLDTPGRSLDEKHKKELLEYFWQSEGHQFLIFAHSGEYGVEETVKDFKGKLAKAWTLSLPSDHKSCYIPDCESEDVLHDAYAKKNTCQLCQHEWDLTSNETMILEVKT